MFLLKMIDLFEMLGQHFLIGRDHSLSVFECRLHDLKCSLCIVDQLDYNIDFRIIQNLLAIVGEKMIGDRALLISVFNTDLLDLTLDAMCFVENVIQPLANASEPE